MIFLYIVEIELRDSADNFVIIWTAKGEIFSGSLRYKHNDPIQCLAFNPISEILVSCTATDFGISKDNLLSLIFKDYGLLIRKQ